MAKPPNELDTRVIKVSGNKILQHYLKKAVDTGLYGNNSTAAAGILLSKAIQDLIEREIIEKAPPDVIEKARRQPRQKP